MITPGFNNQSRPVANSYPYNRPNYGQFKFQSQQNGKPYSQNQHPQYEIRETRKFRCPKHRDEFLVNVCYHQQCLHQNLMCDACVVEDSLHSTEHKKYLHPIDELLESASETFRTHRLFLKERPIIAQDLISFVENEERNIQKYIDNIKLQKKQLEEHSSALIKSFIDLIHKNINEIKSMLDLHSKRFVDNYVFFSEKLQALYDNYGIKAFARPYNQNKMGYQMHIKGIRDLTEMNGFIQELRDITIKCQNFENIYQSESKIVKKDHEDEIVAELRKGISKIYEQAATPPSLGYGMPANSNKHFNINFYNSYLTLMKDIEKVYGTFYNSLNRIPPLEDLTQTSLLALIQDSNFFKDDFSASKSEKENKIESEEEAFHIDIEVRAENYFNLDTKFKVAHYFEAGTPYLHMINLKELPSFQLSYEFQPVEFVEVQLNIAEMIPYNFCSLATPSGKIFLCGGCENSRVFNNLYEVDFEQQTLVDKSPMLTRRCLHGICMIGQDYIVVAGGCNTEVPKLDSCEVYNIKEDSWNYIAKLNKPCESPSLCNFSDKYIYKIGGVNDNTIERYTIEKDIWEIVPLAFNLQIGDCCESIQINSNNILIFGGPQGKSDQCLLLSVFEDEEKVYEELRNLEQIKLPEKFYFNTQKSALVFDKTVYAIESGNQNLICYRKGAWSILN